VSQHISTYSLVLSFLSSGKTSRNLFGTKKLNRGKAKSFNSNRVAIDLEVSMHVAVEAEFVLKCSMESLCYAV
jgi:hypothetical protein